MMEAAAYSRRVFLEKQRVQKNCCFRLCCFCTLEKIINDPQEIER